MSKDTLYPFTYGLIFRIDIKKKPIFVFIV